MPMSVKERILAIRLAEKAKKNPGFLKEIKVVAKVEKSSEKDGKR